MVGNEASTPLPASCCEKQICILWGSNQDFLWNGGTQEHQESWVRNSKSFVNQDFVEMTETKIYCMIYVLFPFQILTMQGSFTLAKVERKILHDC